MTGDVTSRQIVPKSPACPEGLFLMDGIEGLRSLPKHSVDMLLTDPPYGTTRNFWDVPLPLPELWEAVKWAVKPDGAVLFFAQCPYDKVLGASNLSMLRYEWVWYKSRCTGFLNARRAPLKRTENILVFYQKLPYYDPQFEQGKPYKKISRTGDNSPKAARYSKKYLSEHETELATYRAARATMNELLDGAKLPKMADMKKARRELAGKKKALYAEYRKAQADMRQTVAVNANIDHLLGVTDGRENKAQER